MPPASHHQLTTGTSKKLSQLGRDHPKWPLPRHSVLVQPLPAMNRTHMHPSLCAPTQAWFAKGSTAAAPQALLCCRSKTCTGGGSRDPLKSYSQGHGRGKDHHQNQVSIIHWQIIQSVVYYAAGSEAFELFSSDLTWVQNEKVLSVPHQTRVHLSVWINTISEQIP